MHSNQRLSPRSQLEQEKRIRREIANSNERRRMQSINAGFNSLRTMLPKHDGEKLSKAAILQHTAEYIYQLEQEKTRLLQEMCQFKRMFNSSQGSETDGSPQSLPPLKKIKIEPSRTSESTNSESSDEGIQCQPSSKTAVVTSGNESDPVDEMRTDLIEVRKVLDRERRLRMQLEDQVRSLQAQLYPERIKEIAQQVQLQFNETMPVILQNNEETAAAVSSVLSDEVVAETIEIETHSFPESPLHSTTIVIQTPSNPASSPPSPSTAETPQDLSTKPVKLNPQACLPTNNINNNNNTSNNSSDSSKNTNINDSNNNSKNSKSAQPAAIALPIDVPFVGSNDTNNQVPATVTLRIIGSMVDVKKEVTNNDSNSTSRQNLNTIVEAIRHLEGDHLFRDDIKLVSATVSHPI